MMRFQMLYIEINLLEQRDALKEEMEMVGVIKVTQVEASQQKIANIVRKLEREGAITIVRNFGGDFVE